MRKTEELNETKLISEIEKISLVTQKFNKSLVIKSIGDDCAIFRDKNGMLVSTDNITENVHFTLKFYSFYEIGSKSLLVNLSDIAAMGGVPRLFTLSLFIPKNITEGNIKEALRGIVDIAKKYRISLIGGNISRASEFSISITIIGDYKDDNVIKRGNSKIGDAIFISGEIGNSWMSYYLQKRKKHIDKNCINLKNFEKKTIENFIGKFKLPIPRIKLAKELAAKKLANSLTDISDGLRKDIFNILNFSHGAEIWIDELPINENLKHIAGLLKIANYMDNVLSFGEDYELLWTAGDKKEEEFLNLSNTLGIKIKKIGRVVKGVNGIKFMKNGIKYSIKDFTFKHL
ncbi:MAG: thiamine-phosphate kinase [Deltaproteobacteria bacterium]|nr:thiamine-phosphate kinase [Deltaproteobacteria bacterium]